MSTATPSLPMRLLWDKPLSTQSTALMLEVGHHYTAINSRTEKMCLSLSIGFRWFKDHFTHTKMQNSAHCETQRSQSNMCPILILFNWPLCKPTEKIYRLQHPIGHNVFRPDLNFEGVSDREIEVKKKPFKRKGAVTATHPDSYRVYKVIWIHSTKWSI